MTTSSPGEAPVASGRREPLRVVLVDDSALFRQGVATLLQLSGVEVMAQLASASALFAVVEEHCPHVVITDVRMPPTHTSEGIEAALALRDRYPTVGVLVLSTYAEGQWAIRLFANGSAGLGYLLKDRVTDAATLVDAIARVRDGHSVVDPEVVARLLAVTNRRRVLSELSEREREVLTLMAEGLSNVGIGRRLFISSRTVETYIAAIFTKLPLADADNTSNRRVLSVLAFLHEFGRDGS